MLIPSLTASSRTLAQSIASPDLIVFLRVLPDGRKRRRVCYQLYLLLLMAISSILSGCTVTSCSVSAGCSAAHEI
jgi:hypothetical protein